MVDAPTDRPIAGTLLGADIEARMAGIPGELFQYLPQRWPDDGYADRFLSDQPCPT